MAGILIHFLGFTKAGMIMAFVPLATALVNLKLEQDYETLEGDDVSSVTSSEYDR